MRINEGPSNKVGIALFTVLIMGALRKCTYYKDGDKASENFVHPG